jgi:uncharacterized hydrophobic protein (TIGR00341 family)
MSYRLIEIRCETANIEAVESILNDSPLVEWWKLSEAARFTFYKGIIDASHLQKMLDASDAIIDHLPGFYLMVQPLEALHPQPKRIREDEKASFFGGLSREELLEQVNDGSQLNFNYLLLLILSTIVAAIGLHNGDLAVVIGAMVIAPLLQPHISFSLAAALGDWRRMGEATIVNIVSVLVVLLLSFLIGLFWPVPEGSINEVLLARTRLDYSNLLLALAAGAAAVLSLTTGVSSALVGVMVAVALMPPLAAAGLLAGIKEYSLAVDALWLALANIVCINLASKLIFQAKGIRPGNGNEKKTASHALILSYSFWAFLLVAIVFIAINQGIER